MRDRKGVDFDRKEGGESGSLIGSVEAEETIIRIYAEETIIRIYYVRKESIFTKRIKKNRF